MVGVLIIALGVQRYYREVYPLTPEQLLQDQPTGAVRMLGMVEAGTLMTEAPFEQATFYIAGKKKQIQVLYQGEPSDNLRELKTLVVVGRWDNASQKFQAHEIALIPNYGFITAAYLIMVPMALFLFMMERSVLLLYNKIKLSKLYEPEVSDLDEG